MYYRIKIPYTLLLSEITYRKPLFIYLKVFIFIYLLVNFSYLFFKLIIFSY